MGTYTFNQSRKVITVEKTTIDIEADSYEEAVEKAQEFTPFSEHDGAIDEDYFVTGIELDEDMVIEFPPEDNNGEATVETWYGDKFLFDNKSETETTNARLKRLINEAPLGAFYIQTGMEYMKRILDLKTDEEVYNDFCGLFAPGKIRNTVNYMHRELYPDQYKEEQTTNS